jgi:chromosome segregation ATPase
VPDAVQDLFDMDEINIQGQHDAPFLINDSPGAVGRYLNTVANLDSIDISLSNITKMARKADQEQKQGQQHLAELEHDLEKYADLEAMEGDLKAMEALAGQLSGVRDREQGVRNLLSGIETVQAKLDKHQDVEEKEAGIGVLEDVAVRVDNVRSTIENLSWLVKRIEEAKVRVEQAKHPTDDELQALTTMYDELDEKRDTWIDLNSLIYEIKKCEKRIDGLGREINSLTTKYDKLMPDVCPLCGSGGDDA